jgi:hypothetical protein
MRKLIIIFIILLFHFFSFISFSSEDNIYYCIEESSVGFNPNNNYKLEKFKDERYKVFIDFEEKLIKSDYLYFGTSNDICKIYNNNLYCTNFIGGSFSINKNTLKFHYTSYWIDETPKDHIFIAHGNCEKF